jgi:hypothetical protein
MDDWNLQRAGRRLRVIRSAAGVLPLITDYWSLITDHETLVSLPAQ